MNQYCTLQIFQNNEWQDCAIVELIANQEQGWRASTRTSYLFEYAIEHNKLVIVTVSKHGKEGKREADSFYDVGVVGNIMRKVALPDGKIKVLFQGLVKGHISEFTKDDSLFAKVDILKSEPSNEESIKSVIEVLIDNVKKLSRLNVKFPADLVKTIEENDDATRIADLISSVLKVKKDEAYKLFAQTNIEQRLFDIIEVIKKEIESFKIQKEITQKVNSKIEKTHKDYFLKDLKVGQMTR